MVLVISVTRALFVVGIASLSWILFGPNSDIVSYGSFKKGGPERVEGTVVIGERWKRRDVYFYTVDGSRCHGWFYEPSSVEGEKVPVIVMASGLGAQIDFGMDKYAEAFAASGKFACLLFDYRGFGSSDGEIRNLIDPWRHIEDWRSALAFVALPEDHGGLANSVDITRVGLWGSSMSGGHVLVLQSMLAAEKAKGRLLPALEPLNIKAVVAQTPHLDGRENRKKNMLPPEKGGRGLGGALRITRTAIQDMLRTALQHTFIAAWVQGPAYIPIVGNLGDVALMPLPADELKNYFRKHPKLDNMKGGGWQNMAPARIALKVGSYSPIDYVPGVNVPVLFVAGSHDSLCPSAIIEKAKNSCHTNTESRILTFDAGHFELYYDKAFEASTKAMIQHFSTHLN